MASLRVLAFDPEGRLVAFDTWHDDMQLPPATADVSTRSQWLSRDATARSAICNHLPASECAHFGEHRTAQALYDAVVARYSSLATAAIGRLLLPYLFPEMSDFATVADLVTHLRTSDARYRATVPAEFLPTNQPPMFITLYFIVTRLPDSLRSVRDHFLTLDPTSLTVDLLEQHLLEAETSAVAVGATRGTPRSPFFEGCSPSPLSSSFASAAAADVSVPEDVGAALTCAKRQNSKGKGGWGGGGGSGGGGGGSGSGIGSSSRRGGSGGGGGGSGTGGRGGGSGGGSGTGGGGGASGGGSGTGGGGGGSGGGGGGSGGSGGSGGGGTSGGRSGPQRGGLGGGRGQQQQRRSETQTPQQLRARAGRTCGRFHTERRCFARLDDAWRAEFGDDVERPLWAQLLQSGVVIFDLDFDVIISAMYALSFSAEGDCYRCVPPGPGIAAAALGASASGTPPGTAPDATLHTFTLDSGASRCFFRDSTTLTPLSAPVPVRLADPSEGPVVAHSSTLLPCPAVLSGSLSGLHLPSFSTNLVSTAAFQDAMVTTTTPGGQRVSICTCTRTGRHLATSGSRLLLESPPVAPDSSLAPPPGHPSLPRLRGMHSRLLVSGLPRSLPPLPPSPAPPCLPCVEGRQRAAPHSSSFPPKTAPLQTLHMDVIRTVRLRMRERFGQDLHVLRLQSDRGGDFSSVLLRDFCRGEGITQSFTLLDSPQQNGIAERRIGLVMEVAHTSMIHAAAPHFPWPFAVRYAAHQLNLWPHVSLPETSPTVRWTRKVGDASVFRVGGSRAFVCDMSADKLSARAIPCVFLGFVPDAPGWQFYHPTSRRVLPSQDVTFNKPVPFYRLFPYRSAPPPPPPLFLAPGPPPVDPLLPQGPAPSGVSQVDPLPSTAPVQVAVVSGAAPGASSGGAASEGAVSGGAEPGESEGAESGGAEPRGAASSGGPAGASRPLSLQQLREWLVQRAHRRTGARGAGAGLAGVGGPGGGGTGAAGAGAVDPGAGGVGGTVRPRPYFVPLLQQVLGVPSSMLSPRYCVTVDETVSVRSRCSSPSNQVVMSSVEPM
ncbi:unnamed protein product [Closterium sp. NIES-53]